MRKQVYAYGWVEYRSIEPTSKIADKDGNLPYKVLRIYNAFGRDPELTISVKGEKFRHRLIEPQPDPDPDLQPGTHVFFPLSKQEIEKFIQDELDSPEGKKTIKTRAEKRRHAKACRKYYESIAVFKTIEEPPQEGGENAND